MSAQWKVWKLRDGKLLYNTRSTDLPDYHILAHILRNPEKATQLLDKFTTLRRISKCSLAELKSAGLTQLQADSLYAACEFSRRLASADPKKTIVSSPVDVAKLLLPITRDLQVEKLYVLCLDAKNQVTKVQEVFSGTLDTCILHPREIFKVALQESAASIIIAHNHPSGDTSPSRPDIQATKQAISAGTFLQITVLDHIILGDGVFTSMKEERLI